MLLTFTETQYRKIARSDDPSSEHLVFSFGSHSEYQGQVELITRDQREFQPGEYTERSAGKVRVSPDLAFEVLESAGKG